MSTPAEDFRSAMDAPGPAVGSRAKLFLVEVIGPCACGCGRAPGLRVSLTGGVVRFDNPASVAAAIQTLRTGAAELGWEL